MTNSNELPMPHDAEAEIGLVNLAIQHSDYLYQLEEAGLTPNMFWSTPAGMLYELVQKLNQETGTHPTLFNIRSALIGTKRTPLADEPDYTDLYEYFTRVVKEVVSFGWFNRYLERVMSCYKKRLLIADASRLVAMAYQPDTSADECLKVAATSLENIENVSSPVEILGQEVLTQKMFDYYEEAQHTPPGIAWGFTDFDRASKGTRLGEYTVLKAFQGSGKSTLIHQTAHFRAGCADARAQLIITVGDMTAAQIVTRIMQQQTGVSNVDQSAGRFTDSTGFNHWKRISNELVRFKELPLYIVEGSNFTSTDVKRVIKMLLRKEPCADVYLDYLQQLRDKGEIYEKTTNISLNLRAYSRDIRDLRGNQAVSITAISAMNKGGEHLGSQAIAHDAENIYQLQMEKAPTGEVARTLSFEQKAQRKVTVAVEKQRNGVSGFDFTLWFEGKYTRFADYTGQDKERGW